MTGMELRVQKRIKAQNGRAVATSIRTTLMSLNITTTKLLEFGKETETDVSAKLQNVLECLNALNDGMLPS